MHLYPDYTYKKYNMQYSIVIIANIIYPYMCIYGRFFSLYIYKFSLFIPIAGILCVNIVI